MIPLKADDLERLLGSLPADGNIVVKAMLGSGNLPDPSVGKSKLSERILLANRSEIAVLQDALTYISSDVPRGSGSILSPDGLPSSEYWLGCIWAVRREFGHAAKELMRKWSKSSPRYLDGSGFEKAWNDYDGNHPKPVTIGSVFKLAKAMGWSGPNANRLLQSSSSSAFPSFTLLDRAAIMSQPALSWRVKKLLPETGVGAIYGPSSSGKSYLAIDLGVSIALGKSWFGNRTTAGPVTYVTLEGEAGLANRIKAWETHNGVAVPGNFKAMIQPFELAETKQVEELGTVAPYGGVVIIDTLNRAAPGLDENSSQDMGRLIAGMKRLQQITGGLVIVVHHTGKDASKGLRGHSSLYAALDGAIAVERSATSRSWNAAKVKDGEDGKQVPFKLHVIDLELDSDGDLVTSCAVGPDSAAIFLPREPTGKSQKAALSALRRMIGASTELGRAGCNPQVQCIKVDDAVTRVADTLTTVQTSKRNNRSRALVQGLINDGYLKSAIDVAGEAWLWL